MDIFSHALLPYLIGKLFKRNKEEVTALVLGGLAPDFDVFILWINYLYPTFFLITHRGITHSLLFGFFTGIIILYLASRTRVKAKVSRFIDFRPTISYRMAVFAYAGVIIHLLLDYFTTKGIPLLYPLDTARWSAEVFFYTDIYLTILSLAIIIYLFKKPLQTNTITKFLVVFLVIFAILGTVRIVEKASAEDFLQSVNINAYPTSNPFDWYVLKESEDKLAIYQYNGLTRTSQYNETLLRLNIGPDGDDGENLDAALDAAGELPQIKMFRWRAYTSAVNASFSNETWLLEYYDPVQRAMMRDSPAVFRRAAANWSSIIVKVEAGKAVIL
ncbi:putative membrane-bound metal-dependent hydrolase [Candidatus Methanoperedens nitroreducens]|uniref:Putative membrane-bound metal-dependent hydrolase n=1 Tax=Candidatus Methanoperedens nitratireducens TaxID=1392998 RepID=A0A062V531_9EURY|nr:metal-dependent hydrolase [Candidatus Methanoperedens nitroreducens]KCZ70490.1 putative membrane-bound metal-dependent hydrolase [Candidatus Methanoperedens nitroreducens]MDJ1420928.1 metal-dependent hydrolase [Candidatus Methanoperedens sp.]